MAALPTPTFPFCALPLELRTLVYKKLLSPNTGRALSLYDDQSGGPQMLNIHPSILQVNRQIYTEASPILYDSNIFKIDLSSTVVRRPSSGDSPPTRSDHRLHLFRCDTAPNNLRVKRNGRWAVSNSKSDGLIYPHCLQRLRHLELVTSTGAVWGVGLTDFCFTTTGDLMLDILRHLAKRAAPDGRCVKTLKVTSKLSLRRLDDKIFAVEGSGLFSKVSDDRGYREEEKKELNVLLQAVKRQRKVTVMGD